MLVNLETIVFSRFFKSKEAKSKIIGEGVQGKVFEVDKRTVKKIYGNNVGQEYKDFLPNPKLVVAQGEAEAWNTFYKNYKPEYATAKIDRDGGLLLPKIPGVSANKLKTRPQDIDLFKNWVSEIMGNLMGKTMSDQKDSDILVSKIGQSNSIQLLPVDFGEYGMYRLLDEVIKNTPKNQENQFSSDNILEEEKQNKNEDLSTKFTNS